MPAEIVDKTKLVLIETLWNVKVLLAIDANKLAIVLIETLWNVKYNNVLTSTSC